MRLLKAIEACRQALDVRVQSLRLDDSKASLGGHSVLWVDPGETKRIVANATATAVHSAIEVTSAAGFSLAARNALDLWTSVDVTETGFRVVARSHASIQWPIGKTPVGWHDFYKYRSGILTCDEAVAEAQAQTANLVGLDTYYAGLGLVVTKD